MVSRIEAIFFDVGNTLRILTDNDSHQFKAKQKITQLLQIKEDPELFCKKVDDRYKVYRKWAFAQMKEAGEEEMWSRWLAPECSRALIATNAVELTYQYRQSMGLRVMVPQGKEVVMELDRRGYVLGMISNVITSREIPDWLEEDGLTPYFKSVALSSVLGIRKPDPRIYLKAAEQAGVAPQYCAYVGDNLQRDVAGTYQAGFGMVIILRDKREEPCLEIPLENTPDRTIDEFTDLLDVFPQVPQVNIFS